MIVPETGVLPALTAVKEAMFPLPLPAKPIVVLLLIQLYVAPLTGLLKFMAGTLVLVHTAMLAGTLTVGVGLIVMLKVDGVPIQPFTVGVTVIVATTPVLPELEAVKAGILPEPLAPIPMLLLLLVHVQLPPAGVVVNADNGTEPPLHTVRLDGTFTVGVGLIIIDAVALAAAQPPAAAMKLVTV